MLRAMTGFHQDAEGHWVAELSCGHGQHVRHRPPFELRPWVLSVDGRSGRLGQTLECPLCERRSLPEGHALYQRTPTFTQDTVPAALLRRHDTKPKVWARIIVEQGRLAFYEGDGDAPRQIVVPNEPAIVLPEVEHRVQPMGEVSFHVEFWRATS